MAAVIETHELRKRYGAHEAVRGLSLSVSAGSICAFLGQNGAGKSSTIKMLLGMVHPTAGSARVLGLDIADEKDSLRIRERVAFVAEDKRLYDYMTVEQIIRFTKAFFPRWRADLEQRLLDEFELPLRRRVGQLSKGMRTKLALLLGFARGCELLILDEPTEGLDPVAIEEVLQNIVSLAADGATIFFSSHQIAEVEQIADHVLMIDHGTLVLDEPIDRMKEQYRQLEAVFSQPVTASAFQLAGVEQVHAEGRSVSLLATRDVDAIVAEMRAMHAVSVDVLPITLKEIFLKKVGAR